jgi:hypothetical protein
MANIHRQHNKRAIAIEDILEEVLDDDGNDDGTVLTQEQRKFLLDDVLKPAVQSLRTESTASRTESTASRTESTSRSERSERAEHRRTKKKGSFMIDEVLVTKPEFDITESFTS